jgi:hypothetical protein
MADDSLEICSAGRQVAHSPSACAAHFGRFPTKSGLRAPRTRPRATRNAIRAREREAALATLHGVARRG